MNTVIWECDRCHAKVEVPRGPPGKRPVEWTLPPEGWISNHHEDHIEDVCGACITPEEHDDIAFTDAERATLEALDFDPDDPPQP